MLRDLGQLRLSSVCAFPVLRYQLAAVQHPQADALMAARSGGLSVLQCGVHPVELGSDGGHHGVDLGIAELASGATVNAPVKRGFDLLAERGKIGPEWLRDSGYALTGSG